MAFERVARAYICKRCDVKGFGTSCWFCGRRDGIEGRFEFTPPGAGVYTATDAEGPNEAPIQA